MSDMKSYTYSLLDLRSIDVPEGYSSCFKYVSDTLAKWCTAENLIERKREIHTG